MRPPYIMAAKNKQFIDFENAKKIPQYNLMFFNSESDM